MGNTKSNKNFLKGAAIFLIVIFVISGVLLGVEVWDMQRGKYQKQNFGVQVIKHNGVEYVLKENVETFLVLGLDKFEGTTEANSYNNDKQADFLMLLVFDNDAKKWTAININRDTMAEMNVLGVANDKIDTVKKQIALAHTYGNGRNASCQNTAQAVSNLFFDLKVNHYISFKMDSVAKLNDLVGGVEVEVLDDFSGIDDNLIKGQKVTLKGEQALTYVRTRYGLEDSSNASRMERQKQFLDAFYEKIMVSSENDDEFLLRAISDMSDHIVSDRSVTQLQALAKKCKEYTKTDMLFIEGKSEMGNEYIEFYPDEDSLKQMVIDLFYVKKS